MGEGHTTFLVGDSVILVPKHWSLSEWNFIQEEKENKTKFYINVHESHWKWVWYKEPKFWHNWNNITSFLLAGRNWFLLSLQGNLVQNIKKKTLLLYSYDYIMKCYTVLVTIKGQRQATLVWLKFPFGLSSLLFFIDKS